MAKKPICVTKNNYFSPAAERDYFSASQVKEFLQCPARAVARINGEYETPESTALMVGSYVDAFFEGKKHFTAFLEANNDTIFKRQTKKQQEAGELPAKYADYIKADEMIDRALSDALFMQYMKGQKQKVVTGKIGGIWFKSKFDVYKKGERIVDLKTIRDFKPLYKPGQGKLSFIDYWEWPLQLAIYQLLEGSRLPVYLAIISKEDPPDIEIVSIAQEKLDAEIRFLKEKLPVFDAYKQGILEPPRCECCAYCRATKKLHAPKPIEYFAPEFNEEGPLA